MLTGDTAGHTLLAWVRVRASGTLERAGWPQPGWSPRDLSAAGRSRQVPGEDGKSRTAGHPHRAIYSHRPQVKGPVPSGSGSARRESYQAGGREQWEGWGGSFLASQRHRDPPTTKATQTQTNDRQTHPKALVLGSDSCKCAYTITRFQTHMQKP